MDYHAIEGGAHLQEARLDAALAEDGSGLAGRGLTGLAFLEAGASLEFGQRLGLEVQGGGGAVPTAHGVVQVRLGQDRVGHEPSGAVQARFGELQGRRGVMNAGLALGDVLGPGAPVQFPALRLGALEPCLVPLYGGIQFFRGHLGEKIPGLHPLALVHAEFHEPAARPGAQVGQVGLHPPVEQGTGVAVAGDQQEREQQQEFAHGGPHRGVRVRDRAAKGPARSGRRRCPARRVASRRAHPRPRPPRAAHPGAGRPRPAAHRGSPDGASPGRR